MQDWREAERRILSSLDLRQVFEDLGVKFTGKEPNAEGWLECHAIDREDNTPSAAINVAGPSSVLGKYKDLGAGGKSLGPFELAGRLRNTDYREAREYLAGVAGVELNGLASPTKSKVDDDQVQWLPWSRGAAAAWCDKYKPGINPRTLEAFGARMCLWPAKAPSPFHCIALPGYRDNGQPTAWALYRSDGRDFPAIEGDKKTLKARKIHNLAGSRDSWIGAGGLAGVELARVVWKVEGPSDALALHPLLPVGQVVLTNTSGAAASAKRIPLKLLAGKTVYIIGDADKAGQAGAEEFANAIAEAGATEARIVRLPFDVAEKHGKDLRDWILEGNGFAELEKLAMAGQVIAATAAEDIERSRTTDLANAERLVDQHGAELRHCHPWNQWLIWDGRRWRVDDTGEINRRAKKTVRSIYSEAAKEDEFRIRRSLAAWAKASEAKTHIDSMIKLARSEHGIAVRPDELDRDPWVLNCRNGTLDLKTGKMRSHQQVDFLTKIAPVDYDPAAQCPTWRKFLERIFETNQRLIAFIQRAAGYSLTGITSERCLFLLHGKGRNGKSTFLETMAHLLAIGEYSLRTPTETLMVRPGTGQGIPNDVARLKGARFVWASESEEGQRLAEAAIKDMTGGDTISARFMRAEWFDFKPEFKLWLATNHRPTIRGTDDAIWDRIRLVPFNVRIPDSEQDKSLPAKLLAESAGILAWAVEGCLAWQREGLGEPDEALSAKAEYRSEMDLLGQFISDCCFVAEHASTSAQAVYKCYQKWCLDNGITAKSQKTVGKSLTERGLKREKNWSGKNRAGWFWYGIGLLENQSSEMYSHESEGNTEDRF